MSRYDEIISDYKSIGYDFRINDLNETIQVKIGETWQPMTDTLQAIIDVEMYELGYGRKKKPSLSIAQKSAIKLGHKQRHHPFKAFFESLPKYTPRAGGYYAIKDLASYFDNPDGYFERWLFRWMIGAIAKVYDQTRNPMLVLAGPQDKGKSTFALWLCPFPDNFMKQAINPDDKDAELSMTDNFMWEVDELPNTTMRKSSEALKSFLTLPFVKRRAAYGRHTTYKPAVCSFIGTANFDGAGFLNDPTGTTRFLTCEINGIDFAYSEKLYAPYLWAEAFWHYRNVPKSWQLTPEEKLARDEINSRYELVSALTDAILHRFEITNEVNDAMTALEIKQHLSGWYHSSNENGFYHDLGRSLRKLGIDKERATFKPGQPHHWQWVGIKKREAE